MIVDDSQDDQILIKHYLQKEGFQQFVSFSSAIKAYEYLQSCINTEQFSLLPNLMLIDIVMPGMGGIELCEIIKKRSQLSHIPILMITSTQDLTLLEKAFHVGAKDFIHKPIKPIELIARVKQATELHREISSRRQAEEKLLELARNIQHDLELAKQVQKSILGKSYEDHRIKINVKYLPSVELSGDLYYWKQIDRHRYGIIICDVRGHGIPGALISMSIHSLLFGLITRVTEPIKVVQSLNKHMHRLYHETNSKKLVSYYFTAIYAVIDTKNKKIEYVNAGHPPGLIYHSDLSVSLLNKGCPPIGLLPKLHINKGELFYKDHATLLLYTDGLTELPENREMDGLSYLKKVINSSDINDEHLLDKIIENRTSASKINDDICLLSVKINSGKKEAIAR